MTSTITTRRLEKSDVEPVLALLRAALGEPPLLRRTHQLFAWKHFDNPFGESIGLVACSGPDIVGLRTFMRWELTTPANGTLRCVRAVDTATHPEFERRGIFRRLTEEAVEEATANGVDMIFNTPNAKSGAGYLTMGWESVGDIGVMIRPTRHLLIRPDFDERPTDNPQVDSSAISDRAPLGLRTPRTVGYLNWRFNSHPTARYHELAIDDSVVVLRDNVRNGRGELLIADIFGNDSRLAVRRAVATTRAQYVAAWFTPNSPERAICLRAGLMPVPVVKVLTLMVRPLRELTFDVGSMTAWDLALSDLELL